MDETLIISGYTNASDQKCVQRLLKKSTHLCVEKTETNSVCVTVEMCVCSYRPTVPCLTQRHQAKSLLVFFWSKLWHILTSLHRPQDGLHSLHFQTSRPLAHRPTAHDLLSYADSKNDACAGRKRVPCMFKKVLLAKEKVLDSVQEREILPL